MTREHENEADRLRKLADARGDSDPTGVVAGELVERFEQQAETEEAERAERRAETALNVGDLRAAEQQGLSAGVYLAKKYDVDVFEYDSEAALLEAVRGQRHASAGEQHGARTASTGPDSSSGGGAGGRGDPGVEQLAEKVLNLADLRRAKQQDLSAAEYFSEFHGVDAAEFQSEEGLRRAIARAEADAVAERGR